MNRLYYGDCLTIMRGMPDKSVDLVYLDPPFNSNRDYSAIYKDETGLPLPDQVSAFQDTWSMDAERERAIKNMPVLMRESGLDDDAAEFLRLWMRALRKADGKLLAYISYMTERLLPLKRILKPTGSVYFHCDPTASHYVKVMMDAIFGYKQFLNEVIWWYDTGGMSKNRYSRKHDVILYYSNGKEWTFNVDDIMTEKNESQRKRFEYAKKQGEKSTYRLTSPLKYPHDVFQMHAINPKAKERVGYATQKPLALLERIIMASSKPGDVVFDPFCGCATTIEAAHNLGRNWIGIDIAIHAIKRVARVRLEDRLGLKEGEDFTITGVPLSLEGAQDMWERDPFHFQKWAIEQIDGFVTSRKTGDGGIDGRLYFSVTQERGMKYTLESMVLEVKGGKSVNINVVRDLRGVLERDEALMAGLIVMEDLSPRKRANFIEEMATAGDLEVGGISYPKMQILTIPEIIEGKRFKTPSIAKSKDQSAPKLPLG